jgi:hypothetical protein
LLRGRRTNERALANVRELVLPIIRPRFGAVPLALLLLGSLLVERANAQAVAGRCAVRFFGTSTLHDFEGNAPSAVLEIGPPDANGEYRVHAELAVAQLGTGISARARKMRAMFEAKRLPRINAWFDRVDAHMLRRGSAGAMRSREERAATRGSIWRGVTRDALAMHPNSGVTA